jgi:hypothetical protein
MMAQLNTDPVPLPPAEAIAALEEDLPIVLQGKTLDEVGWVRLDPLTLLMPMVGVQQGNPPDDYLLRLGFGYYREWPPSAQFVNPETKQYTIGKDARWLPKLEGCNEIHVHADYESKGQLICSSITLEFYKVRHGLDPKHLWDSKRQNFAATLATIRWALRSDFYKGRQG